LQNVAQVIAFVGVLIFLAHLFTGIFSRTRIPDVIFLIIIGVCVGPVLGLTSPPLFGSVGPVFITVTLIIILFESGIALRLSTLRSTLGGAMLLAPLSFFSTMLVVAGFAIWLTDLETLPAFILGAIVGSTSETVVIPLVRQLALREETKTLLSVESSVNDVLSIVITIALVEAYTLGKFEIGLVAGDLVASFLVALVFGIVGALIWSILLNRIHAIKNAMFTTPAFVFIIFGIVESMGFSGAIAALAFGVTIGNIGAIRFPFFKTLTVKEPVGLNETERVFFSEVAFLMKAFFFIYLGISLELVSGWFIIVGLVLTIVAFVLRIPAVKLVSKSLALKDASVVSIMVPKGLAAVVLASIPLQQGIIGGEIIKNITYGVVLFSIVFTSVLVILLEKTRLTDLYARALYPGQPELRREATPRPREIAGKTDKIIPDGTKLFGGSGDIEKRLPEEDENS
jgi:NhaP-type Na+/H+ or K+/H+ antiporter